jgi:hypothetical protein
MQWQLLTPLAAAVVGGFVVHMLTARRDRANKRREQRSGYLIEAYRRLESSTQRHGPLDASKLESAVADIQLFGSPSQVQLVQEFAAEFAAQRGASLDALLRELRRDLRVELNLESVPDRILHLRIKNDENAP